MIFITKIERFDEKAGEGLLRVRVVGTRSQQESLWTRGRTRKSHTCAKCRCEISKGANAWRTVLNADYRMHRLCETCVMAAIHPTTAWCELCDAVTSAHLEGDMCEECGEGVLDLVVIVPCDIGEACRSDDHHFGYGDHFITVRRS